MIPSIIYQCKNYIAINKPAGLLVHTAEYIHSKEPTVASWALSHFPQIKKVGDDVTHRPGIVHRLDKETSGIMLVALTQEYFLYLKNLFATREIQKTYWAITHGIPVQREGTINKPIGLKAGTTKRSVHGTKMIKEAVTDYRVMRIIKRDGEEYALVEARPRTGRTHQIRVHLAFIHTPIIGDPLYGGKNNARRALRCMLHARALTFKTKEGVAVTVEAPIPDDFEAFIKK